MALRSRDNLDPNLNYLVLWTFRQLLQLTVALVAKLQPWLIIVFPNQAQNLDFCQFGNTDREQIFNFHSKTVLNAP